VRLAEREDEVDEREDRRDQAEREERDVPPLREVDDVLVGRVVRAERDPEDGEGDDPSGRVPAAQ
jgi:hypothetical protein